MEKIIDLIAGEFKNFSKVKFLIDEYLEYAKQILGQHETYKPNVKRAKNYIENLGNHEGRVEIKNKFEEVFSLDTQKWEEIEDIIDEINKEISISPEDAPFKSKDTDYKNQVKIFIKFLIRLLLLEKVLEKYDIKVYWLYGKIYFVHKTVGKFLEYEIQKPSDPKIRFI